MVEIPPSAQKAADDAARDGDAAVLTGFLRNYSGHPQLLSRYRYAGFDPANDADANAKTIIACTNCFTTWAEYEKFNRDVQDQQGMLLQFELAADAIVEGDAAMLKRLLRASPALIGMRSVRNHHSTLLNYVGANGFEGWRQKTPKNAVEIAGILLDAGGEADAWGDMYGGTSTLGLVATSVHPVTTGVQQPLMDILIQHGADPNHAVAPDYTEGNLILACLHNGRGEPVHYLAAHGADVDIEGACALGRLDIVQRDYAQTSAKKRATGLTWACEYGHTNVVDYLLGQGLGVNTQANGATPLHAAAYGGQLRLVEYLIGLGADMETLNAYGGTVLGQTLWCLHEQPKQGHLQIMELLIEKGAHIKQEWKDYITELRQKGLSQPSNPAPDK